MSLQAGGGKKRVDLLTTDGLDPEPSESGASRASNLGFQRANTYLNGAGLDEDHEEHAGLIMRKFWIPLHKWMARKPCCSFGTFCGLYLMWILIIMACMQAMNG